MNGFIYILRNTVNNKVYIGQTKVSVTTRWQEHLRHAKYGDQIINRAMKKYGVSSIGIETNMYRFSVFTQEDIQGKKLLIISLAGVFSTTCIGCILSVINIFADSSIIRIIMWIYYIHLINILPFFGDGKMIIKALVTMKNV